MPVALLFFEGFVPAPCVAITLASAILPKRFFAPFAQREFACREVYQKQYTDGRPGVFWYQFNLPSIERPSVFCDLQGVSYELKGYFLIATPSLDEPFLEFKLRRKKLSGYDVWLNWPSSRVQA